MTTHEEGKERTDFIPAYSRRTETDSTFQRERRPNLWGIVQFLRAKLKHNIYTEIITVT
jgi:hypothetical protein